MGNRKLPFGYQMRMGEIVRNESEAQALVAVHNDLFYKRIEQLRIKAVEEVRPILQRVHEVTGVICQIVAVGVEKPCFFLFQPAELFVELVIG